MNQKSSSTVLGGSWVVIGKVISTLSEVVLAGTILVIALLRTAHEPPSKGLGLGA